MTLVGVTGTNGKTTTTYLVEAILAPRVIAPRRDWHRVYRGGNESPLRVHDADRARPPRDVRDDARRRLHDVVMEVSSAALVNGPSRRPAVRGRPAFSNLTQDHLDSTARWRRTRDAKRRLFADHLTATAPRSSTSTTRTARAWPKAWPRTFAVSVDGAAGGVSFRAIAYESTIEPAITPGCHAARRAALEAQAADRPLQCYNLALAVGIAEARAVPTKRSPRGIAGLRRCQAVSARRRRARRRPRRVRRLRPYRRTRSATCWPALRR